MKYNDRLSVVNTHEPLVSVPYVDAVSHWMGSRKGSSVGTFNSTT